MVCKISPKNGPRVSDETAAASPDVPEGESEVADFDTALHLAGYGRLSCSVLCACAGAFFTTGVQNALSSYVLPAAGCELQLSTYRAGLVNVAFMCGGVASAFFWGVVADVFGPKRTLAVTLLLDAALTLAQSSVHEYSHLVAARAVNGFLIGGPSTIVMTYLSDLVGRQRRQLFLNITGLSFTLAWLVLPALAWLVIPYKPARGAWLGLDSWRLFLAACSAPGLLSGLALLLLPESPRRLLDTDRAELALAILANVFSANTGRPTSEYPVKKLVPEALTFFKQEGKHKDQSKTLILDVLSQMRCLVSRTYSVKISLISFIFFANMAAGFGLSMWIPELLVRMKTHTESGQNGSSCSVATMIHADIDKATFVSEPREIEGTSYLTNKTHTPEENVFRLNTNAHLESVDQQHCKDELDDEVYISGLIVGVCCVLGNVACACVCSLGARGVRRACAACALVCAGACAVVCACVCACAGGATVAVAAIAVLNSAALNGNVLLLRLLLHALPPRLSALGVCWGAWWGRAGGVATNLAVGALLDVSCAAPFLSVAALLAVSAGGIMLVKDADSERQTAGTSTDADAGADFADPPPGRGDKTDISHDRYITTHM